MTARPRPLLWRLVYPDRRPDLFASRKDALTILGTLEADAAAGHPVPETVALERLVDGAWRHVRTFEFTPAR